MDITAINGSFGIGFGSEFNVEWNKKDKSLSVWAKEKGGREYAWVQIWNNEFVDAFDASGNLIAELDNKSHGFVPVTKEKTTLKFKTLPDPELTASEMNKERKQITRYLISGAPYSLNLPDSVEGIIKWMQGKLNEIPAASRKKASFRFDTTVEYGETYPNIEITYSESETDKEIIERIKISREVERRNTIKEKAKLECLKKKYAE